MNISSAKKIAIIQAVAEHCSTSSDLETATKRSVAMISEAGINKNEAQDLLDSVLSGKTLVPVQVSSKEAMDEEVFAVIVATIQQKHKDSQLVIDRIVDSSMSGGFRVRVKDQCYDYSVDMRLNQLREKLIA